LDVAHPHEHVRGKGEGGQCLDMTTFDQIVDSKPIESINSSKMAKWKESAFLAQALPTFVDQTSFEGYL
jgi:hypothetical protein